MLSVHIMQSRGSQAVVVIRHHGGVKPNALRHDVVFIAGSLARGSKLNDAEQLEDLLTSARAWIEAHAHEAETLPAVPGYGLVDRLRRHKRAFRDSRNARARLLRALRRGEDRDALEAEHGRKAVDGAIKRWRKLRAIYPRRAHQKRGGGKIAAGGSASKTLLTLLVAMATKLRESPTWSELAAIQQPPLTEATVLKYLDLLREVFKMQISESRSCVIVHDWGLFRENRLI